MIRIMVISILFGAMASSVVFGQPTVLNAESQAKSWARALDLTADQQGELATILKQAHNELTELLKGDTLDQESIGERIRHIDSSVDAKVMALLNESQKIVYQDLKKNRTLSRRKFQSR